MGSDQIGYHDAMIDIALDIYLLVAPVARRIAGFLARYPWQSAMVIIGLLTLWATAHNHSFRYCIAKLFTLGIYPRPPAPPPPVEAFRVLGDDDDDDHLWEHHDSFADMNDSLERKRGR